MALALKLAGYQPALFFDAVNVSSCSHYFSTSLLAEILDFRYHFRTFIFTFHFP